MNEPNLDQQADDDELRLAQTEVRHLKDTIGTLREELEGLEYEKQESVQRAVANANDEAKQLIETATGLLQLLFARPGRREAEEGPSPPD